jgi:adenine/guanine/hypoxanthine permease
VGERAVGALRALLLDLFDTIGTLTALGRQAGFLVGGRMPRARGALAADAAGTAIGALLGTSIVTSYVESAAGVAAGGRTGLTAVVVGLCMLASLVLTPLVRSIGAGVAMPMGAGEVTCYPVIAPVLVLIGALMMGAVRDVDWDDLGQAIPAFLGA